MRQGTAYAPENVLKLVHCACGSEKLCRGSKCGCLSHQLSCTIFFVLVVLLSVYAYPINRKDVNQDDFECEEQCLDLLVFVLFL